MHRDLHDWVATILRPFTFIAAVAAAYFTYGQLHALRDQLILEHPPRLIVTNIAIYKKFNQNELPEFVANELIEGTVWVVNTGREVATIKKIDCMPYWTHGALPLWPVYYSSHRECKNKPTTEGINLTINPNQNIMKPGDVKILEFSTAVPQTTKEDLYILGYFVYQDQLTPPTRHALFFGRKYDRSEGYFVKVDNTGYEHEE